MRPGADRLGEVAGELDPAVGDDRRARSSPPPLRSRGSPSSAARRPRRRSAWCRSTPARSRPSPHPPRRRSAPACPRPSPRSPRRSARRTHAPSAAPPPRATPLECPCAVSMTTTSTPASTSATDRSKPASPTVEAAATRSRPSSSLAASGFSTACSMSLMRQEPGQPPALVDHQQLLDPPRLHHPLRLGEIGRLAQHREILRGHHLAHRRPVVGGEAHVAVRHDPEHHSALVHHRKPGDAIAAPAAPWRPSASGRAGA